MPKDSCYHSVKARYDVFPSARASQAIAKCRKGKGSVRKSDKGTNLKRWQSEKWTDTKTGKACGAGGSNEYCRPKNKVSSKTPKTIGEMSKSELKRKKAEKSKVGMGRRVTSLSALGDIFELDHPDWAKHKSGGTLRVERDGKMHYDPQNKPLLPFGKKSRDFKSRKKAFREAYIANKRDNHILATKRGIARAKANREMEAKDELFELAKKENYNVKDKALGYGGGVGALLAGDAVGRRLTKRPQSSAFTRARKIKMLGKKSNAYMGGRGALMGGGGLYVQKHGNKMNAQLSKYGLKPDAVYVGDNIGSKDRLWGRTTRDTLGHELGHRKNIRAIKRKIGVKNARRLGLATGLGFTGARAAGMAATVLQKDDKKSAVAAGLTTAAMAPRLADEAVATGRVVKRNRAKGLKTSKRFLAANIGSYGALAAAPWVARSIMKRSRDARKNKTK